MHRDIIKCAADYYRWGKLDSRRILADRGFAKLRKELQAWQPSNYPLSKAKSLYEDRKDEPRKRQRLSEDLFLTLKDDEELATLNVVTIGDRLRMVATTWAVVGCYDVPLQAGSQEKVKMISWEDADYFVYELTSRIPTLREKFTDPSVVKFLTQMYEHFCSIARDQTRSSQQTPYGKALLNALRSEAHKWQEFRDFLVPRETKRDKGKNGNDGGKGGNSFRTLPPPPPPKVPNGKGGKQKGTVKAIDKNEEGKKLCSFFNRAGCREGQNCKDLHECNALMPSGKPCGSKSHGRSGHQVARDGVPQYN